MLRPRAIFLDRDGVVDELVRYVPSGEWEAPRSDAEVRLKAGVIDALRQAQSAGWLLFLITNQPSYAKGKCSLADLEQVHGAVVRLLRDGGVTVTQSYVCYHHPESRLPGYGPCQCRKPSPFFLNTAAEEYGIDLEQSWMVGDRASDIEAGRRAGCRTALILDPHSETKRGSVAADMECSDLNEFVSRITLR